MIKRRLGKLKHFRDQFNNDRQNIPLMLAIKSFIPHNPSPVRTGADPIGRTCNARSF
jgi:hypothetical protein